MTAQFKLCHTPNRRSHFITIPCHYKVCIWDALEYFCSCFYKVFRSFLEGNTPQESNNFFIKRTRRQLKFFIGKIHRIMHCRDLLWRDPIFFYNYLTRPIAYCNHVVSPLHSILFYIIYNRISIIFPSSVIFGSVYVYY